MRHFCGTTTRGHKNPKQGTLKHRRLSSPGDNSSSEDARIPGSRHCQKHGALHPIRGAAPDQGRCTRTEEVHCLRIGCSAPTHKNKRGTGNPNHSRHNQPGQPPALGRIAPQRHKRDRTPLHALLGTASGSMGTPPTLPPIGLTGSSHLRVWGVVLAWGRGLPDD